MKKKSKAKKKTRKTGKSEWLVEVRIKAKSEIFGFPTKKNQLEFCKKLDEFSDLEYRRSLRSVKC